MQPDTIGQLKSSQRVGFLHENRAQILVAGKDAVMRSRWSEAVRGAGHEVTETGGGLDLLRYVGSQGAPKNLAMLILDISDNPWAGFTVLRAVQSEAWTLPVVLVTDGNRDVHAAAKRLGVEAIVERPVDAVGVRNTVACMLPCPSATQGMLRETASAMH